MKDNNFPITTFDSENFRKRKKTYDMVETIDNATKTIGVVSEAACNYAKTLKVSSQMSLIRAHEKLQDTVRNSTLDDSMLREILGDDYDNYN